MIRRPPRSTHCISSAASDVYKRQVSTQSTWEQVKEQNKQIITMRIVYALITNQEKLQQYAKQQLDFQHLSGQQLIEDKQKYFCQIFGGQPEEYKDIITKNPNLNFTQFIEQQAGKQFVNLL
eukprot:TRINITY_DN16139_c0_g1_i2.p4 TRINITY_DN16139_c0_g1~~TRINITY_DN16139_c0_g1_i2.p4  ORF type:complete len:122 (-),score=50.07 TRINITY_DN16139_c0_g1_i2:264-629(-)